MDTSNTILLPSLRIRTATEADLPAIVGMLADDVLGAAREAPTTPLPDAYLLAFRAIAADANNELLVAGIGPEIVGTFQMTFIPTLSYQGSWRALIEAVRVHSRVRSQGIGTAMMRWAIDRARARGCARVLLSTNKVRHDAHRFYASLGFVASHEGMQLDVSHR
jgi:GNAT superfamily N-acetyltransferase